MAQIKVTHPIRHGAIKMVRFIIAKTKYFMKLNKALDERQRKVLVRVFEKGVEGF
jgi:hypothetical protein